MGKRDSWMSAMCDAPKPEFTSDEVAWLGMGSDVEAEQRAARSVAAMVAKTCAVRPFPATATRVIELTGRPERHVREVVRVIETDPTLATRLLRYVNSAACGLKVRCKSLYHAVTLLGPRRIRELVTSTAVLSMFERGDPLSTEILEHAAVTGALARLIGERFGLPSEEMLACGLLHDLGKLMMLDSGDLYYAPLLGIAGDDDETLCKLERDQYGFDHAVLAGQMLVKWRIPSPIPRVVAWHHQPGRAHQAGGKIALMVETLRFSDQVAEALQSPRPDESVPETIRRIANGSAASYLDIDEEMLARMWAPLDHAQRESRALFHGDEIPLRDLQPLALTPRLPSGAGGEAGNQEGEPEDLHCALCNESTYGASCPTCRRPVCDAHDPGMGFCLDCEEAFAAEKDLWSTALTGTLAMAAGAASLLLGFSAFLDVDLSLALGAAFLTCFSAGAGAGARRWARRRAFRPDFADEKVSLRVKTAVVRAEEFEAPILLALEPEPDGKRAFKAEDISGMMRPLSSSEPPCSIDQSRFATRPSTSELADFELELEVELVADAAHDVESADPQDPTRELRDDVDAASESFFPQLPRASISAPYGARTFPVPPPGTLPFLRDTTAGRERAATTLVPPAVAPPERDTRSGARLKSRKAKSKFARVG